MNGRSYRGTGAGGINVALGIWLIISPFVLGFAGYENAKWNDIASGIAVGVLAMGGGSWWNVLLGIWLIISPFVLGFAYMPTLLWNNVILGALVGITALIGSSARSSKYGGPPPA